MSMIDMSRTRPHACGGTLRITAEMGTFRIHDVDVPVKEYFWRCDHCEEELLDEDLAEVVEQEAAEAYRATERRLAPVHIRALRERFSLTQDLMERALGLGPKTWVRWESGRVIPNRAMDNLLRLLERDPGALLHLAEVHGIELPGSCTHCVENLADGRGWPKALTHRLQSAADRQETDVNSYLIMVLTQHLTDVERIDAAPPIHRSGYTAAYPAEQWKVDHDDVMEEFRAGGGGLAV